MPCRDDKTIRRGVRHHKHRQSLSSNHTNSTFQALKDRQFQPWISHKFKNHRISSPGFKNSSRKIPRYPGKYHYYKTLTYPGLRIRFKKFLDIRFIQQSTISCSSTISYMYRRIIASSSTYWNKSITHDSVDTLETTKHIAYWQELTISLRCVLSSTPMFKVVRHARGTRHQDINHMDYCNHSRFRRHLGNRSPWTQSSNYHLRKVSIQSSSLWTNSPRWLTSYHTRNKDSMHQTLLPSIKTKSSDFTAYPRISSQTVDQYSTRNSGAN